MTGTAVSPLHLAIVTAIEGIGLLAAPGVYNEGEVPPGAPLPYAIIGTMAEPDAERYLNQPGRDQVTQIKWWADDKVTALSLHNTGAQVLDGATFAVTGHRLIRCRLGLLTDFKEPNVPNQVAKHVAVSQLRTSTVVI